MDKPKVLPLFAAFLLFLLNTASGAPSDGWLSGQKIFSASGSTEEERIIIDSEYSGLEVEEVPATDSQTSQTGEPGSADKTADTQASQAISSENEDDTTDAGATQAAPSKSKDETPDEESKLNEPGIPSAVTTGLSDTQASPTLINSDDKLVFDFYQHEERLIVRPMPADNNWMIVERENGSGNVVLLHIDDSAGSPENVYYSHEASTGGRSFHSRATERLEDSSSESSIESRAVVEVFRHPVFVRQYASMRDQSPVAPTSLRAFRLGSLAHCALGWCFKGYSGLEYTTFVIRIELDHGNYRLLRVTLAIPNTYNTLALGAPRYCRDGKKDPQCKKDDGDHDGPGGKAPDGYFRRFMTNLPGVNRLFQSQGQQSEGKSDSQSGTPGSDKKGKQDSTEHLLSLHKQFADSYNEPHNFPTEQSVLTIQHEIDLHNIINQQLKTASSWRILPVTKPGIEYSYQQAGQQVSGY